jgi:hypothetical protein
LQWLISASTWICAQSNREVHRASTSDGIPGGQPNRVQPRRTAQKKTTSQFTSSCFGLVQGSGKWHKEHALSNHAKSESSRMGRDWPVKPNIRNFVNGALAIVPLLVGSKWKRTGKMRRPNQRVCARWRFSFLFPSVGYSFHRSPLSPLTFVATNVDEYVDRSTLPQGLHQGYEPYVLCPRLSASPRLQ